MGQTSSNSLVYAKVLDSLLLFQHTKIDENVKFLSQTSSRSEVPTRGDVADAHETV